eukprot:gb/GFBE01033804.1/.p1 GENE.gb/GFBE01033804.1/~~gb/GFBE01033804.1/.p1  ORF type:complete len:276 (+),score=42.11 gb/GFBE01033804.1/:1-828(+)
MGTEYRNNFIAYDRARLSDARLSTPPGSPAKAASQASSRTKKLKDADLGNTGNRLQARLQGDALATICPPWSTPYCSYVREQPTTLKHQMTRVSDGLAKAQERLEARRYQPTYADHGLAFRMQQRGAGTTGEPPAPSASDGASSSSSKRRSKSSTNGPKLRVPGAKTTIPTSPAAKVMEPKEAESSIAHVPLKHPLWWGQAALPPEPDRPTYEDLGEYFPRKPVSIAGKEMLRSESVPLLYGKYKHDNPFLGTGAPYRRGPGGVVVCDVSLAPKL